MRELTDEEIFMVSGAVNTADAVVVGGALGAGVGLSLGASAGNTGAALLTQAGLGSMAGGAVVAAGALGWAAGNLINEHTPVQSWISNGIDRLGGSGGAGGSLAA